MLTSTTVWSQDQSGANKQTPQQKAEELKQSLAANRTKLAKYQWVETTQVTVKGDTKKQEQQQCYYGAAGKVQKTPIGSPGPSNTKAPPGGLKGKIIEKKLKEAKDDMEKLKDLVTVYVPPNPQQLQQASQAGKASIEAPTTGSLASVTFNDYAKPGDKLTFSFDSQTKKIRSFIVNTYQDNPKDVVTLAVDFASLQDGTNYDQQTILESKSKQTQIKTTNSGYKLMAQ